MVSGRMEEWHRYHKPLLRCIRIELWRELSAAQEGPGGAFGSTNLAKEKLARDGTELTCDGIDYVGEIVTLSTKHAFRQAGGSYSLGLQHSGRAGLLEN